MTLTWVKSIPPDNKKNNLLIVSLCAFREISRWGAKSEKKAKEKERKIAAIFIEGD